MKRLFAVLTLPPFFGHCEEQLTLTWQSRADFRSLRSPKGAVAIPNEKAGRSQGSPV